jgi:BirA family biotin operon repressor/biotin-[acetyl-CoA-carboxylase] ligase
MNAGTAILEAFYQAAGQFVPPGKLARLSNLPAGGVIAEIRQLEKLGYTIESHPHLGYRLLDTPDRLTADDIRARLHTHLIGSDVLVFEQTTSTNDIVEQLARSGAREGLVVFAESQTRGRGRHGRSWASPRGKGLWFSVLLRPKLAPVAVSRLTVAASVAVARALRKCGRVDARIKWPNDVTVRGKKLAGILTEMRAEIDDVSLAILGIGIDVNCTPGDFPRAIGSTATSLQIETGQLQDRLGLAVCALEELDYSYRAALEKFEVVIDEWAQWCTTLGRQIVVQVGSRRIEGHAQALDGDGALLVRTDNGRVERIVGGDLIAER